MEPGTQSMMQVPVTALIGKYPDGCLRTSWNIPNANSQWEVETTAQLYGVRTSWNISNYSFPRDLPYL